MVAVPSDDLPQRARNGRTKGRLLQVTSFVIQLTISLSNRTLEKIPQEFWALIIEIKSAFFLPSNNAHLNPHLSQPFDTLGSRRMGRKQLCKKVSLERVDYEHVRGGRVSANGIALGDIGNLFQCACQSKRFF